MEIHRIQDFSLFQEHEVIISQIYLLEGLLTFKAADVSDIICPEVQPGGRGVGRPVPRRRGHCVKPVAAMVDWAREADWHYDVPHRIELWELKTP